MSSGSTKEAVLRSAYTELAKAERGGDWERALKASNRILKQYPQEVAAFQCKIVCFIQLSKFEEVLTLLRKAVPSVSKKCTFEKAYCEYRLNRTEEALTTLKNQGEEELDFRSRELLAQLLYRQEKFADCQLIYRQLLKDSQDEYDQERQANFLAVYAHLKDQQSQDLQETTMPTAETYEQLYNEACALIAADQFERALNSLLKAESLCRAALVEEGAGEEEVEEEVALIRAQQAFCRQMTADLEAAAVTYAEILKQKPSDSVLVAVVSNNVVSIRRGDQLNLFDTRKKLKTCQASGLEQKLTKKQRRTVAINNALLQLHSNQYEPCRRGLGDMKSKFGHDEDMLLIEASLLVRQKDWQKAAELLKNHFSQNSDTSDSISFFLAHIYLCEGRISAAVDLLNGLGEKKWSPAVLSLLVAIHLGLENKPEALKALVEAVEFYNQYQPDSSHLAVLVEQCATLHARLGDQKAASKYLEDLRRMRPQDPQVLARLIQAYSEFDPKKAEVVCHSLPPMDRVEGSEKLDLEELETSGWILLGEKYRHKKEAKQTPKPDLEDPLLKGKKKKKRKSRMPKNYDPNIAPDPERWIPKFERSTYKKKKDKRAKERDIAKGTQGAVATAVPADIDSTKKAVPASPKPAAAPPSVAGPRQQRPGAQSKPKKKKKGGAKW